MTAIWWVRRDFRLSDNPALIAAAQRGAVIPVFILDPVLEAPLGAASRWRLHQAIGALDGALRARGSRLILRRGPALAMLRALAAETGAAAVIWSRLYDAPSRERDAEVKTALRAGGLDAQSAPGHLLHEPWVMKTGAGGPFKVYSPFARACFAAPDPGSPLGAPELRAPQLWPESDALAAWDLERAMNRGGAVVAQAAQIGEAAAQARLGRFIDHALARYKTKRDFPAANAVSNLSENLTWGEISPRQLWAAGSAALAAHPSWAAEGEHFLKEVLWREFAWSLHYHWPDLDTRCWKPEWEAFPWRGESPEAEAWRRGETGEPIVDAAMRQLYATGTMHNRLRMIAASYLTKHLLTDWRIGEAWFRDTLIDWDPASNAMGWQWVAGCGPDAAPYFRIFNPATQAAKFDPEGVFIRHWLHGEGAAAFYAAAPRSWKAGPGRARRPIIALDAGRNRALAALQAFSDRA